MKHARHTIHGGRPFAAALAALLLLPAATVAAPQACGCEKRQGLSWSEHLNYYSNMVSIVKDVDTRYSELEDQLKKAQAAWKEVDEALETATELKDRIRKLKDDGAALKAKFQTNRDNRDALIGLKSGFETFLDDWNQAVNDQRSLYGNDGWETELRKGDKAYESFKRTAGRFMAAYQKAEFLRFGSGGNLECVIRQFDETDRKKETADTWAAELSKDKESANDNRLKLLDMKSDMDSDFVDMKGYIQTVAEFFGLPDTATPDQIKAEIDSRTVERVTIRFGNLKLPIEPQTLRKGIDKPERVQPDPEPNGPGFLGWRERSNERDFDDWDQPLTENMQLDAKWGYTIWVGGEKLDFDSSDWSDHWTWSAIFNDDRVQRKQTALTRQAPKGKMWDGWASDDKPTEPIRTLTASAVDGTRLVPCYSDVSYTLTFVVPEGNAPPPQQLGYKDMPRVPDVTTLESFRGYRYIRWSLEPGGKKAWNGEAPLTNDLSVYAVPEADFTLRFHGKDKAFIEEVPVRASEPFSLVGAPKAPDRKGETFRGWIDGQGRPFRGGLLTEDANLYAEYGPETTSEMIRRLYRPLEERFPLESVACCDAGLVILLGVLGLAGRKPRTKKRGGKAEDPPPAEGDGSKSAS